MGKQQHDAIFIHGTWQETEIRILSIWFSTFYKEIYWKGNLTLVIMLWLKIKSASFSKQHNPDSPLRLVQTFPQITHFIPAFAECIFFLLFQPSSIRGLVALWKIALHAFLSLVLWSNCPTSSPIHDVMFINQIVCGLPRLLVPRIVLRMIFFRHSPSFRMTCPKLDIFRLLIDFSL